MITVESGITLTISVITLISLPVSLAYMIGMYKRAFEEVLNNIAKHDKAIDKILDRIHDMNQDIGVLKGKTA